ncbi:class I SAM-dependent methyltransferase [Aeromonas sobria]|uniref:class I SAM-dependent methyltransferase n=1 Tax=Aeromonas sobria TaxID=646 RepID=UPI00111A704F|nr:class I SAM-dependent methyltransferase [Aeromonas sobria]TNI86392.1 hypothetical protein CF119_08195 [Aeromonas sobria]
MMILNNQGLSYDIIAEGFAEMRDSFYTEEKYIDLLINNIHAGAHILDVGCGSGFPIANYLVEKGFQVTGIDGSRELLNIAKRKCPKMRGIYGDVRFTPFNEHVDAIVEWWCLFHLPQNDHELMISRFEKWLKPGGVVQFTSGDSDYQGTDSNMLNQELHFYSLTPVAYEALLKKYGFKLLLKESDQEHHLVWLAKKAT